MQTVGSKVISKILEHEKLNANALAQKIGLSRTQPIYDLQNSKVKKISSNYAGKILEVFPHYSYNWLLTGEGEMLDNTQENSNQTNVKYIAPYIGEDLIPVSYVSGKTYASFIESMYGVEYDVDTYGVRPEEGEDLKSGKFMVFDIEGDSMHPTIQSGSKILCEKISECSWEYAKGVIVIVYGKTLTVKRILKNNLYLGNTIILKADNPTFGEMEVERSEIRGIWQASRVISMKII